MSIEAFHTPEGTEVLYTSETLILRKIRRWTYRGDDYAECWMEDEGGVEQKWGDTPLSLPGREGHVYCVVRAAIKGRPTSRIVGAINLTTERYELTGGGSSPVLGSLIPDHAFGRWWMLFALVASLAAAFNWSVALDKLPWLLPWHAIAFPFAAAFVGFWVSIFIKPVVDPTMSFNDEVKRVLFDRSVALVNEQPPRRRRRRTNRD